MAGRVRIGISGWTYRPWRGVFYPKGLAQKKELAFAAERFGAIEINGSFYRMQRPENFASWHDQTPDDFCFAVKAPRYITHMLKLRNAAPPTANFFASGLLRLGRKLGPILWQFPPQLGFDAERFEEFLALLPRDTDEALRLARDRHDHRVEGRSWLRVEHPQRLRHAFEIRHDTFRSPDFLKLLRRYGAALVCADTVSWPRLMDVTADFLYVRLHGSKELYVSGYGPKAIQSWARRVRCWREGGEPADAERVAGPWRERRAGRDVFVFFDNDAKVRAPADALSLQKAVR